MNGALLPSRMDSCTSYDRMLKIIRCIHYVRTLLFFHKSTTGLTARGAQRKHTLHSSLKVRNEKRHESTVSFMGKYYEESGPQINVIVTDVDEDLSIRSPIEASRQEESVGQSEDDVWPGGSSSRQDLVAAKDTWARFGRMVSRFQTPTRLR